MKDTENIRVYIDVQNGKTICICKRDKKLCDKDCEEDTVTRDKFRGWYSTFHRDQYGK